MKRLNTVTSIILTLFVLVVICQKSTALEVLESGYHVETYASYPHHVNKPNLGIPREITFGLRGDMYLSMWEHYPDRGYVCRVSPNGEATIWLDGLGTPRRIVVTEGTEYGDCFYLADGTPRSILRAVSYTHLTLPTIYSV